MPERMAGLYLVADSSATAERKSILINLASIALAFSNCFIIYSLVAGWVGSIGKAPQSPSLYGIYFPLLSRNITSLNRYSVPESFDSLICVFHVHNANGIK